MEWVLAKYDKLDLELDGVIMKHTEIFNSKIFDYIKESLKKLGYPFIHDDFFKEFCSKRLTRVGFDDNHEKYEFYVDYVDENNTGIFVGAYEYETKLNYSDNKIDTTLKIKFKEI